MENNFGNNLVVLQESLQGFDSATQDQAVKAFNEVFEIMKNKRISFIEAFQKKAKQLDQERNKFAMEYVTEMTKDIFETK